MELGSATTSVLVSPLAVDDVFRHRTVPEVQELLRQLQLQQANDVEELRSLIGVRYLSFLEGLPEISRMQRSAKDALEDARSFGAGLCRLADSLGNAASEMGEQHAPEHKQLQLEEELPLQNSTPLDDFLFSCEVDAPRPAVYFSSSKGCRIERASRLRFHPCSKERQEVLQGQAELLRYLQQRLLLLPSRVWEAARCQRFLEALRLIYIEGTKQAAAARAAACELQKQQKQGLKPAHEILERQISGCRALAQQVTRISPSLIASLRALAIRQLASPGLPLPVVADAAAAATLIYLLENRPSAGEACEEAEGMLSEAAAKWLLGVFFSARVEALESIVAKSRKDGGAGEVTPPALADSEKSNSNCETDTVQRAVDAAEAMLVAFSASLEAAVFLFSPGTADSLVVGATDTSREGAPATCSEGNRFAAGRAAECAFCDASAPDSPDISWALKALKRVFAVFAAQPCRENGNEWEWRNPCGCKSNSALCPRARMTSFIEQWSIPLREQLCLLPAEDPRRSLKDIRFFWLRLMERLKERGAQWQLPRGPLFFVCGAPPSQFPAPRTSSRECRWALCDEPLCSATLALLDALGKACTSTCISISERRVRALPLLSCHTLNDGTSGACASLEIKDEHSQNSFERNLLYQLIDIGDLFGRAEDPQDLRAALSLRASIAASFLQSLSECAAPLARKASATVVTSVESSDGYTREKDAYAALILDARRVEWLLVAYREAETLSNHDENVVSTEMPSVWGQTPEDLRGADCRRRVALFLAEWISLDLQHPSFLEAHYLEPDAGGRADVGGDADSAQAVAAARAAVQSLLPSLCFSSFVGYAVGFWPFVRTLAEELQRSWQWHRKASATHDFDAGVFTVDISGGAMSFLLELNRHLTLVSRDLKVERISDSLLLPFALKAIAAEAVADVAAAAIAEAKGQDHHQQGGHHASSSSQGHLLQLLVDIELLAKALDEPSPVKKACGPSDVVAALPQALHRAVEAGLGGRRCTETLRNTAEEGRQWLQPSFEELLKRRLETGFVASSSLIWALMPSSMSESRCPSSVAISTRGAGNASQLPLLEPCERLSLLPVAPLPAFEVFQRSSSYEKISDTAAHKPVTGNAKTEREHQQAPKEAIKQLHRLRLDDAVDSVSRGLQSWLKRGSSDADGSGLFPSRSGGGASTSASKGVTAVAAAGSGLAEAWAKQEDEDTSFSAWNESEEHRAGSRHMGYMRRRPDLTTAKRIG